MEINKISIIEYLNSTETSKSTITDFEPIILLQLRNKQYDTAEIIFENDRRDEYMVGSRVAIENEFHNWYIANATSKLVDKNTGIYQHTLILTELKKKLEWQTIAGLSFNNFKTDILVYENLWDVVKRVNRLAPFEITGQVLNTRLITSVFGVDGDDSTIEPLITDRAKDLLVSYTNVPEFQFVGKNVSEAYDDIFGLIGGTHKVISTNNNPVNKVLDIELFDDKNSNRININKHYHYESNKNIESYGTSAEIQTNNIIDNNSLYIAGIDYFKHIGSKDKVLDEAQARFDAERDIYRLKKVIVKYKLTNQEIDATDYVKSQDEWNILDVVTNVQKDPSTQNTLKYKINASDIDGFAQTIQNVNGVTSSLVWVNFMKDIGFTVSVLPGDDTRDLFNYLIQVEFIALNKANRFNVKTRSYVESNIEATINLNLSDRINESSKLIKNAQNKITQVGARKVIKKVEHNSTFPPYELGDFDTDTGLKILVRELIINRNSINATYTLVRDLNYISDFVGVNSEIRFTDVEIGKGLTRNEIYEDYCLFSTQNVSGISDSSSVKSDYGKQKFINLFTNNHNINVDRSQQFLVSGTQLSTPALKTPSILTGDRTIVMDLNFLNQTFIDNKISPSDTFYGDRQIERGVRYTGADATIDTLALSYGYKKNKDKNSVTLQEVKDLPEAQDLLILDTQDIDYEEPIIEIGTVENTLTENTQILDVDGVSETSFTFSFVPIKKTITKSYVLDNDKQNTTTIDLDVFVDSTNSSGLNVIIDAITEFNATVTSTESLKAIPTTSFPFKFVYDEFEDGQPFKMSIDMGVKIKSFTVTMEVNFEPLILAEVLGGTYLFENVTNNYNTITTTQGDGLLIDKNQNEILGLTYQMHYSTIPELDINDRLVEPIILGSALTTNSPLILANNKNYESFNLFVSDEPYGRYEDKAKGLEIEEFIPTGTFLQVIKEADNVYSAQYLGTPVLPGQSYAIVGVRADGSKDFMYAVNPKEEESLIAKVYIFFTHNHPSVVKNN